MGLLKDNIRFRILFLADALLLLLVTILQAGFLDYMLFKQFEDYSKLCVFWFLDLIVVGAIIRTFVMSYKYFSQKPEDYFDGKTSRLHFWCKEGTLPMSYFTWFMYVGVLLIKLAFLCIGSRLAKENPQKLQVCLAVSTIVFMLLVEGHNWRKKSTESYAFMTGVCKKNGIEIFDSVEILELFFNPDKLTREIKLLVFFLAAFNFILPTLSLYRLSLSEFGTKRTSSCLPLKILQNVLRFISIDVPFFVIRLHIWIVHRDLSMFMMKNFFNIVMSLRELYLDVCAYFKPTGTNDLCSPGRSDAEKDYKESATEGIPLNMTGLATEGIPLNTTCNEETQTDDVKFNE